MSFSTKRHLVWLAIAVAFRAGSFSQDTIPALQPVEKSSEVTSLTKLHSFEAGDIVTQRTASGSLMISVPERFSIELSKSAVVVSSHHVPGQNIAILLIKREIAQDAFVFDRLVVIEVSAKNVLWREVLNPPELAEHLRYAPFISAVEAVDHYPIVRLKIGIEERPHPPTSVSYRSIDYNLVTGALAD